MKRVLSFIFIALVFLLALLWLTAPLYGQPTTAPTTQPDYSRLEHITGLRIVYLDGSEVSISRDVFLVEAQWAFTPPTAFVSEATRPLFIATVLPYASIPDPCFLSPTGSDASDGKTPDRPRRSIASATVWRNGVTVLLQRGGTFDTNRNLEIPAGGTLTWYGTATAAAPVVRMTGSPSSDAVVINMPRVGGTVDGVNITASTSKVTAYKVIGASNKILNSTVGGVEQGIILRNAKDTTIRGCVVAFCPAYGLYGAADDGKTLSNTIIDGCSFGGSRGQTGLRFHKWDGLIIRGGTIADSNPDNYQGKMLRIHDGKHGLVEDVTFTSDRATNYSPIEVGPLAGGDGGVNLKTTNPDGSSNPTLVAHKDAAMRVTTTDLVFRHNRFDDSSIWVDPGMVGLVLDNNVMTNGRDHVIQYHDDPAYAPKYRPYPTITATGNVATVNDPLRKRFLPTGAAKVTQSGNTLNGQAVR